MNKLIYILTFAMSLSLMTAYSPPDSCLKIWKVAEMNEEFHNPDSVRVDSCSWSETYLEVFADKPYLLTFNENIIPRDKLYPEDTIITYNISDIDSKFDDVIENFQQLENKYGSIIFIEVDPDEPDVTKFLKRELLIQFNSYLPIERVINDLEIMDITFSVKSLATFGWTVDVESDKYNSFSVYPNPSSEIIRLELKVIPDAKNLSIYSLEGIKVKTVSITEQVQEVNISDLKTGIYFLKVGNKLAKFVKK